MATFLIIRVFDTKKETGDFSVILLPHWSVSHDVHID